MNVIVFGEAGSGKSSLVNLLLGSNDAAVSDEAVGCTFEFTKYPIGSLNLLDTVGLSEGSRGTIRNAFAVKKLYDLLKSLEGGVSLLILVMKKGRITKSLEENYKLFVDDICMKNVPVVLAITHCDDPKSGNWWNENKKTFDSYGWNIQGALSCSCPDAEEAWPESRPRIQSMRDSTKRDLLDVIHKTKLNPGWVYKGGVKAWLQDAVHVILCTTYGIALSPARFLSPGKLRSVDEHTGFNILVKAGLSEDIALAFSSAIKSAVTFLNNI